MESDHLTTRTYTALTCKLIVSTTTDPSAGLHSSEATAMPNQRQSQTEPQNPTDFTLELDRSDCGDSEHITLQGNFPQLDLLQQVVSKYITELVAKFPFPDMNNHTSSDSVPATTINQDLSTPEIDTTDSIGSKLYPSNNPQPTQSGLMNNLPGLRNISAQSIGAGDKEDRSNAADTSGISRLFGGWNKSSGKKSKKTKQKHTPLGADAGVKSGFGKREVEDLAAAKAESQQAITTPYLTGNERSLDRQLHLGDLANSSSGDTITLSPIQLFDLSTVLDEYAAEEVVTTRQNRSVTLSQANIPGHNQGRSIDVDATTVSLARLPNLPRMATGSNGSQTSQVFNRTRTSSRSRPSVSLLSVIPWAAAAAVAVGVPMLLFDSKPNPLKDATSKIKMPDMEGVKKTVTTAMSPPIVDPEPTNPTTPKQWNEQPVAAPTTNLTPIVPNQQPSTNPNLPSAGMPSPLPINPPINTGTQPTQANSQIGTAPLPSTLDGKPNSTLPTTAKILAQNTRPGILSTLPRNAAQSGIAPNPLSDSRLPSEIGSLGSPTGLLRSAAKPGLKSGMPLIPDRTTKAIGRPNSKLAPAIKPGTVSVSTQPILLPSDLPGIGIDSSNSSQSPVNSASTQPRPAASKPKSKAKLTPAAKAAQSKSGIPTGVGVVPQPLFEQGTPVPANPNFIDPIQPQTGGENTDQSNLPIVPAQPVPTNTSGNWPSESIDSPAIQATRSYFQSKWKPSNTQTNPLQYVVQVNGKSGLVRSVAAQGTAATTYLNQSKIIKAGQKLVSPAPGGTDQKIRVVLQPDGNVDTFMEP